METLLIIVAAVLGSLAGLWFWYRYLWPLQRWLFMTFLLLYTLSRSKRISHQVTTAGRAYRGMVRALQGRR